MIAFILIASFIALIDASGSNIDDNLIPLIYFSDSGEVSEMEDTSGLTPEQLADQAKKHIFGGTEKDG